MPKINIDHETLDGIVRGALEEFTLLLENTLEQEMLGEDRKAYEDDIKALKHVLSIYSY